MDLNDFIREHLKFCPVCGTALVVETTGRKGCDEHGGFSVASGVVWFNILIDGQIPNPRMF